MAMTMPAREFQRDTAATAKAGAGPLVEATDWGYIIRETDVARALHGAGGIAGRAVGTLLLLAGAGLWVLPNAATGEGLLAFKLALTALFTLFGGYLLWAGRAAQHPEFRIDTVHREIRVGHRGPGARFRQTARVEFADIGSVFLLRSKEHLPARLFLRLVDLDTGVEIACGCAARMEALKERLSEDISGRAPWQAPAPRPRAHPRPGSPGARARARGPGAAA